MQRNVNESFAAYKVRRAAANLVVKRINWESKGGSANPRAMRIGKGLYGVTLAAHFAKRALEALTAKRAAKIVT